MVAKQQEQTTLYREAIFYFLTGTGNSYRVATWLADAARNAGAEATVHPIEQAHPADKIEIGQSVQTLVGLVMPTHGFTAPWSMIRFARRLPRRHNTHAVVVATRAGTKFGRLFLPGFEGTATHLIALILAVKGYRVRGKVGVDMPSNWIALHPSLPAKAVRSIIARAQVKAVDFAQTILSGKRHPTDWLTLSLGLLLSPFSLGYLLIGRYYLTKLFFASEDCTGCGLCAQRCPAGAIKMWGSEGRRRPYWTLRCESCMRCMAFCPVQAVEASHPLAITPYVLASVLPLTALLDRLVGWIPQLSFLTDRVLRIWVLEPLYPLLILILVHPFLSLLLRVPWINWLFTHTTPTHYYRRYHEPHTHPWELN